ncbi:PAS domain S-box protein [Magnetospirillum sp. SS-4]|uniref:sensor histidine kinase n=1 Tax=Magnetospirillum sp. SS-4 TaxID=2681465 RepID=UPI001381437C|nr:PAS domain S-box protein [Magnetospirillum sp. SS-4]CAA7616902.1 putative Histidine kinase [Magnetospirillum sp. SS-4]
MFRLLRYFSLTSAVVLIITAVLLVTLYRGDQMDEHIGMAEEENARLATAFASTFWRQFAPFFSSLAGLPPDHVRKRGELRALDIAIDSLTAGLPVLKVKVYDARGLVIYSPVRDEIGAGRESPGDLLHTALAGRAASKIDFRQSMRVAGGMVKDRWVVETYSPIWSDDGKIAGILELYSDVSPTMERLESATHRLILVIIVMFALLYAALFLIVRRADTILSTQHRQLLQSRADLHEKEERFRAIADYTFDWESWLDQEGRPRWVNPAVERLAGYSQEHCLSMADFPLPMTHPDDRALISRLRADALAGGFENDVEFRLICGNGAVKWAVASFQPIFSDQGVSMGSRWSIRDITDRKKAEQRLRDSERRFRSVARTAADAIISIDDAGVIISWNEGAERIYGYREADILGRDVTILMPDSYRERHTAGMRRYLETGDGNIMGIPTLFEGIRRDGEVFPVELTLSHWEMDGAPFFTAILRDITERKAAEGELAKRTRELERSNAELTQFAYVASHDLQEPLRTVTSFLQLLQRRYASRLDKEADEYIGFAVDGARRMHRLITDLLTYSRVSTHGERFLPVDMNAPLATALGNLNVAIAESGARVTFDRLPAIEVDEAQMVSLFQNLVGNALKYRGTGIAPRIHVGVEAKGDDWLFSVRDNGIGIAAEHFERIFVIFQRLHLRDEYDGTGVGLAVSKKIVERHGGRVWVESSPGNGSTFFFSLPARHARKS